MLLTQYHCLLSEQKTAQLKWSRFVNTMGTQGCNVPCDLHLEHLNRHLKGLIAHLRLNVSKKFVNNNNAIYPCNAINRAACSIGVLHDLCTLFESECGKGKESGNHNTSFKKDVQIVVKILVDEDIFTIE